MPASIGSSVFNNMFWEHRSRDSLVLMLKFQSSGFMGLGSPLSLGAVVFFLSLTSLIPKEGVCSECLA